MALSHKWQNATPNRPLRLPSESRQEEFSGFLEGFSGFLHVDGYAGYESIEGVELAGCWAHVRRKFDEALKALKVAPPGSGRSTTAKKGLEFRNRPSHALVQGSSS